MPRDQRLDDLYAVPKQVVPLTDFPMQILRLPVRGPDIVEIHVQYTIVFLGAQVPLINVDV